MPKTQQKNKKSGNASKAQMIHLEAIAQQRYFVVSEETLCEIERSLGTGIGIFIACYEAAIGLLIALFTTTFKNSFVTYLIIILFSATLTIGIIKHLEYLRNKRRISLLMRKIRQNKCHVSSKHDLNL